jgi:O-antigen ligase
MTLVSSFLQRDSVKRAGIMAAGTLAALALALGVPLYGTTVLALASGLVICFVLLTQPLLGLYLLVITLPIEELLPSVNGATGTRVLGMVVFGMWGAHKLLRRESWMPLLKPLLVQVSLLLLVWVLASAFWANDRGRVFQGLFTQLQLLLFAVLIIDVTTSWERVEWVVKLLVLAGIISAYFTVNQYFVLGVKRAGDGVAGGVNFTASSLVTLMPLAFYLIQGQKRKLWSLLALIYTGLGAVAIAVTFSRSSYLLLAMIIAIYYVHMARRQSSRRWLLVLTLLVLLAASYLPQEAIVGRTESILPATEAWLQTLSGEAQQAEVRGYHWRVGLEMFNDSPILGVGYNNFGTEFLHYQFQVEGSTLLYSTPRSPHSSFVGILADLGLVGLALWLAILAVAVRNLSRAWGSLTRQAATAAQAGRELALKRLRLTQALSYMFLLQLFYSWALNSHQNKNFWLVLALTVVVGQLALQQRDTQEGDGGEIGDGGLG